MTPKTPLWDADRFDETAGHAETLTRIDPPDPDPAVERAIAAAQRAGGIVLERALGFVRCRREHGRPDHH